MCYKHWRDKRLNPSGFRVVSREYPHEPVAMYKDLRCANPYSCMARQRSAKLSISLLCLDAPAGISVMQMKEHCGQLCHVTDYH